MKLFDNPSPLKKNTGKKSTRRNKSGKPSPAASFPILLFTLLLLIGLVFNVDLTPYVPDSFWEAVEAYYEQASPDGQAETRFPLADETSPEIFRDAPFRLTVLDVGQGLSVFVQSEGETMLYDGGDREASSFVVSYLERQGLERLDYVTISHYDSDHLSGVVGVLNRFPAGHVLAPDYKASTAIFRSYQQVLSDKNLTPLYPAVGDNFSFGGASFTVLGPSAMDPENFNNNSLAIRIVYGNTSFLLTGDAEHEEEEDMCKSWGRSLLSTVYVVGHHGSGSSSSWTLLENAVPEYAVISCGRDNSYGHPHDTTLEKFSDMEIPVYRTDTQGSITILSDGDTLTWFQEGQN